MGKFSSKLIIIIDKLKAKQLTLVEFDFLFWMIIAPIVFGSFLCFSLIETVYHQGDNSLFFYSAAFFTLPWVVFLLWVKSCSIYVSRTVLGNMFAWFVIFLLSVLLAGACSGYTLLINAMTGSRSISVGGVVAIKSTESGRWLGVRRRVVTVGDQGTFDFYVSANDYDRIFLDSSYFQAMTLGGLGYPYRLGLAYWK